MLNIGIHNKQLLNKLLKLENVTIIILKQI